MFPAGSRGLFAASKVVFCLIYNRCLGLWRHFTFTMVSLILSGFCVRRKEQFLLQSKLSSFFGLFLPGFL